MSKETYGERVFSQYLEANGLKLDHEPDWTHTDKRPDYRIPHPTGDVVLEIKRHRWKHVWQWTMWAFDPHKLLRSHIDAAREQFKPFADFPCVLALKAGKHAFVDLETPRIMLGAMYGDWGFQIPFDPETGVGRSSEKTGAFIRGRGKMQYLRRDGIIETRNTR